MTMLIAIANSPAAEAEEPFRLNIWSGTPVKANVEMTCYPAGDNAPGVVICPGGSYFWHAMDTEGHNVARWLNDNGISAFVLKYRTAGINAFIYHTRFLYRGNRYPDMMEDVQRAISLLRSNPSGFHVDPHRIGVMGFSAGGHLATMSGLFFDTDFPALKGVKSLTANGKEINVSLKPDFLAIIYPVVSMTHPSTHKRSRRGLLGERSASRKQMLDSLSLENHIRPDMPPAFLMNCKDDPTVNYRNSELLDSAMTHAGVKHKYVQYTTGGHGFGVSASKTTEEAAAWPPVFIAWLRETLKSL